MELNEIPKELVGIITITAGSPIKAILFVDEMKLLDDNGLEADVLSIKRGVTGDFRLLIQYKDGILGKRKRTASFRV